MTGTEIQALNTTFNGGVDLGDTFFTLANMRKDILERSRDWVILRTFDSSISFTAADEYDDTKSLPARFLRVYNPVAANGVGTQAAVAIVGSDGSLNQLQPIKFVDRYQYKGIDGFYYLDLKNSKIGRTGTRAGTLHLYFLQGTEDIAAAVEWSFPEFAHALLAIEVAEIQKGGIDWDTINANQVGFNRETSREIKSALAMWDGELQRAELGV